MIVIDGTYGEGGGQIVRTALALSVLTGQPFSIDGIRARRPQPGLKPQHLTAIRALEQISGATSAGAAAGSTHLRFFPGTARPGVYSLDIGTAGSIGLLLQALLPPLMFAGTESTLIIRGGTCGKGQAPVVYIDKVLLPYLQEMAMIDIELRRHGYYPKGGGELRIRITPRIPEWKNCQHLSPFGLDKRPVIHKIEGLSFAGNALNKARVAERQSLAAQETLSQQNYPLGHFKSNYTPSLSPGSGIVLWANFKDRSLGPSPLRLGASGLGKRGKPAEEVGREAATKLINALSSKAPVDIHLADQLIPFLALVPGSTMAVPFISEHLRSNIYVAEMFLPVRFKINGNLVEVKKK